MIGSLVPHYVFDGYENITPAFLREQGIELLLTDLDFTLAPKSVRHADEAVLSWLASLKESGVQVMVLSNNRSGRRVVDFCAELEIPYVGRAGKPSKKGYLRACEKGGVGVEKTAMLGDKLLTDTLGARRCGMLMLLVEPRGGAITAWQKVLYLLQEPFKRICRNDQRSKRGLKR